MKECVVIDLGGSKTVALAAKSSGDGKLDITGMIRVDSRGMKKGGIVDLDGVARTVDTALRHLANDLGRESIDNAVVIISGAQVEGVTVQGFKPIIPKNRTITSQDVMEVVNHSKAGFLPSERLQVQTVPRGFRVDDGKMIMDPVGLPGSKLEVNSYLITGQGAHVQLFERALTLNHRKVDQFIFGPLASGLGILTADEITKGAICIDIGATKTDLAIFAGGSLAFACSIPAGGDNVKNDLSQLLNASLEESERLKIQEGQALAAPISDRDAIEVQQQGQPNPRPMQRRVLCEIIESRMREIGRIAKVHVEKAGFLKSVPGGVVLTGGGAKLKGIEELFGQIFPELPVRAAEPRLLGGKDAVGMAASLGAAQFILQANEDLSTISGGESWQDKVRGFWSIISGK